MEQRDVRVQMIALRRVMRAPQAIRPRVNLWRESSRQNERTGHGLLLARANKGRPNRQPLITAPPSHFSTFAADLVPARNVSLVLFARFGKSVTTCAVRHHKESARLRWV